MRLYGEVTSLYVLMALVQSGDSVFDYQNVLVYTIGFDVIIDFPSSRLIYRCSSIPGNRD